MDQDRPKEPRQPKRCMNEESARRRRTSPYSSRGICIGEFYSVHRFKLLLDLTDSAFRSLRQRGLPVINRGKFRYVDADSAINWFRQR